jgi:hypothetical protein
MIERRRRGEKLREFNKALIARQRDISALSILNFFFSHYRVASRLPLANFLPTNNILCAIHPRRSSK